MKTAKFSCRVDTTSPTAQLQLTIRLDGTVVFDQRIEQPQDFVHEFSNEPGDHVLEFVLSQKMPHHTRIDESGNIVQDACVRIENLRFNGVDVAQVVSENAEYHHNFNGNGPDTVSEFYSEMGCNGTVRLEFSTPVYLWILEKT